MDTKLESVNCDLCGSHSSRPVFNSYRIVRCGGCGLIYTKLRSSSISTLKEYDRYAREWYLREEIQQTYYNREFEEVCLERIKLIEKFKPRGRLLDIGCGNGIFMQTAQKRNWTVEGVELSPLLVNFLQKKKGLPAQCGNFEQIDFSHNKFDVITMWEVLDHVFSPKQILSKVSQLLNDGGIFVACVNNMNSLEKTLLGEKWRIINPEHHFTYFTPVSIKKLFGQAHFSIKKLYTKGFGLYEVISTRCYNEVPGGNTPYMLYRQREESTFLFLKSRKKLYRFLKGIVNFIVNIGGYGSTIVIVGQKEDV
ncbi:MAG: class I SAM-dependent methyltransferase [Candidatus Omnitrophota bacterium]